jgi:hypothetical protein
MDFGVIFSEIASPMHVLFFCLGVVSALLAFSIRNIGSAQIVLNQNEVYLARFVKWAEFITIILSFYLICGPGGWVYEDMVYLVHNSIILSPEWVAEITIKNQAGTAMQCVYGSCENRTIICNGLTCSYLIPKNGSDAPSGQLILPNSTNWSIVGTKLVIENQSLPRKAEIR